MMLLLVPAIAFAACTPAQRADAAAMGRIVTNLHATASPGAVDAAALATRARRSCGDVRLARAIVRATQRFGVPAVGRRARVLDIDVIGLDDAGVIAWRIDTVRMSQRLATARTSRIADTLRRRLRATGFGRASISWSHDPTRMRWDAGRQSTVASVLAASSRRADRRLAASSVRAFGQPSRLRSPAAEPLLDHLRIANRVAKAAQLSGSSAARTTARAVGVRALARMRGSKHRMWTRIGGTWSTARQHRTLVTQATALVARVPHAASAKVVAQLRGTLVTAPGFDFGTLPVAAFYPWPRDQAFDTQSVSFDVDRPAAVTLSIYAPNGALVHVIERSVQPGVTTLSWDGAGIGGAIVKAGEYRYSVDAVSLLAHRVRVPGLEQFTVARDTIRPTFTAATVRHVTFKGSRRIIAGWDVEEVHSPRVRSWLMLVKGADRQSIRLHDSVQKATVRRELALERGSWRATFVFIDGSGNRTSHSAGSIVVR